MSGHGDSIPWHKGIQEAFHHKHFWHSLSLLPPVLSDSGCHQESCLDLGRSALKHYGVTALDAVPVVQG